MEFDELPNVGDYVQVAWESTLDVWCACEETNVQEAGFNVKWGKSSFYVPAEPYEAWRMCPKDTDKKVAMTQKDINTLS